MADREAPLRQLHPDPGETTIAEAVASLDFAAEAGDERPYTVTNFALTVDGQATISGRSGAIGTGTDTAMLSALRSRADAVMIGAGTMRAERYGPIAGEPLFVIVSSRLELPWDAEVFTCGSGRVLVCTTSGDDPPATATEVLVERHDGRVDLARIMASLRREHGIRSLLCEGGPHLHAELLAGDLVDELFVTLAPKLAGGSGPGLTEGLPAGVRELALAWLLADGSELFARYRVVH